MNRDKCLHKVEEMSKDEFRERIIKKVIKSNAFISTMALGIHSLFDEELKRLCDILTDIGIPVIYPHNEMEITIFKEILGFHP